MGKTKKQLREDSFVQFFHDLDERLRPHYGKITLGLVVVAAVALVWLVLSIRSEHIEKSALNAMATANTVEELQNLPPSYLNTSAGPLVLLKLARALEEQEDTDNLDQLIKVYRGLLDLNPGEYFRLHAHMAMGKILIEKQQYTEAAEEFQAATDSSLTFRDAEAIWYKAWCYEKAGQVPEAIQAYREVRDRPEMRSRLWSEQAIFRLSQLED